MTTPFIKMAIQPIINSASTTGYKAGNKLKNWIYGTLFATASLCVAQASLAAKQPNIVMILTDDAGFEEFGIYQVKHDKTGNPLPTNTPNIDKLGREGVTFKHAWSQAICGPARSMILTGNYAINNGSYDNKIYYLPNNAKKDPSNSRFTKLLKDAGYRVLCRASGTILLVIWYLKTLKLWAWIATLLSASPQPFEQLLGKKLIPDETGKSIRSPRSIRFLAIGSRVLSVMARWFPPQ